MAELPQRKRINDTELMRALAHPTRSALLSYLTAVGARTASECAAAVDSTPSNCSWHLRQLAQFGLVERVMGEDRREHPWQATHVGWDLGEFAEDGAVRGAQLAVVGAMLGEEQVLTQRFLDTADKVEQSWRDASAMNSYSLRITPEELALLRDRIDDLIRPYVATIRTDAPAEARPVYAGVRAFPRIEAGGNPSS